MKRLILLSLLFSTSCADFDSGSVEQVVQIAQQSMAPSQSESISATKQALEKGVQTGISLLDKEGGFSNSIYRILLPAEFTKTADLARKIGLGAYVDDFQKSLNRAAEEAVGSAAPIFKDAITQLTLADVVGILRGPDNAATTYFKGKSETKLETTFLPIVTRATAKTDVTKLYKQLATAVKPAALAAGVPVPAVDLDKYVTQKAVDALFAEIAVQEKKIRENPVERTTALLSKVFGYYEGSR